PGTLLDYSYTVETLKPVMPGDFQRGWRVTTGRLTRRSRYVVDVPATLDVRIKEVNLTVPRKTVEARGRRVYTWAAADVPKIEREPFAADSNGIDQYIDIAAPVQWADVARWYGGLSRDRYVVTPGLDSALGSVVTGARTLDDSLRALHRWVAQDFRYVSLSLGIGGFQPRLPAAVLATRYGDCKDKATLFIALARRLGLRAYPVLLSSSRGIARDQQYGMRPTFATPFGTTERERITRAAVNMLFPGATGDSLELCDGRDLRAEPRIAVVIREAQATSQSGSSDILTLPIHNYGDVKGLAAELEARGPRRFPIDVAAVAGPHEEAAELKLTLPDGWRAQLPPNITARSA